MSTNNVSPNTCSCDSKLATAEAELRLKAQRDPDHSLGYIQAANSIVRVRSQHFAACTSCQAVEDAKGGA